MIASQLIYLRDSPFGVVSAIAEAEAVADWKFYVDLPKLVESVTAEDVTPRHHSVFHRRPSHRRLLHSEDGRIVFSFQFPVVMTTQAEN